ncbi:putative bifunctional diguanylate cyclase/phosphodiesterase [Aquipuribacter hungaricus]|uniref:Bifunctional diguanylate cyclase/phosphodiesterase n=1 Tax=Aquipuribacter hungaricus TaxID=545624 RepID=A0ABV7WIN1_9MICO
MTARAVTARTSTARTETALTRAARTGTALTGAARTRTDLAAAPGRPRRWGPLLLATACAVSVLVGLASGVLLLAAPAGSRGATVLTGVAIAAACVPAGLGLLLARRSAHPDRRLALTLFAAAVLSYGLGQLLNGLLGWAGPRAFPGPGDLVASAAAPLLLATFAAAPLVSRTALPVTRLVVDGVLLGVVTSLCLWSLVVPVGLQTGAGWPVLLLVVLGTGLSVGLPLTAAVRSGGVLLPLVALSVVLFAGVDMLTVAARLGVALPPVLHGAGLFWHLCLPVPMALGLRAWATRSSRPVDLATRDTDARTTTVTSALAGVLLVVVLVGSGLPTTDRGSLLLSVGVVVLVFGREVLLVTTQRLLLQQMTRQVMVDPLTGLQSSLALREVTATDVSAVVALDITGLDSVNQVYGRAVGDDLVRAVGHALRGCVPSGVPCYRVGGDELAVVLPVGAGDDALALATVVQAVVARQVRIGSTDHGPRLAVGVARAEGGAGPLATVLEDAVGSMQLAQQRRSTVPVLHDASRSVARQRRTTLEQRLPTAVSEGRITVLAQPVVDLATGVVVGVEALARWHDETLGHVSPVEFVEAAEHTGVIDALGEHVLRTAARAAADSGLLARGLRLSVNVSPIQLRSARLVGLVTEVMDEHRFAHGQLTLEVTESVLLDEDGPAVEHLHALVRLGVAVAIDDFGAGHASLGYLRRVPAHLLKLDRSLVVAAGSDPRARAVLQAGLELCAGLGMMSVVEGVETSDVALDMSRLGADLGQGWLWSPAVAFDAVVALLDRSTELAAQR